MKKLSWFIMLLLIVWTAACARQDPSQFKGYGVEKGAGSTGIHIVKEGDTVYNIAKSYRLPMREIITLNNLQAPYVLNTGYRMKLPPPNEYRARDGDTVEMIANMYEVSPNRLASLNNLSAPSPLRAGQILRLPAISQNTQSFQQASVRNSRDAVINNTASVKPVEREVLLPEKKPVRQDTQPDLARYIDSGGKFMRPIDGKVISSFGPKSDGLHNDGINILSIRGTPVRAAKDGVIVYNGDDLAGYGNLVLIRHEGKMMTAYAHLDKTLVTRGAKVTRGQAIGTVGSSGQVDTPQLHFEIRKGATPLNPAGYL